MFMADEVGDRRRDRVTENTSRLRLDFLFRANNVEESGPFCSQTQLKIHMGAQASSRMMLRAHLWRAASGRGQVSAEEIRWRCPPERIPETPPSLGSSCLSAPPSGTSSIQPHKVLPSLESDCRTAIWLLASEAGGVSLGPPPLSVDEGVAMASVSHLHAVRRRS